MKAHIIFRSPTTAAAVIFFFTYEAVMIMQTFYSQREPSVSSAALLIRQILTIYCGAALLAFIYFSILIVFPLPMIT